MYGQIILKSTDSKELAARQIIRYRNDIPIPYSHIGISAVEHMKHKEKAAN